MIRMIIPGGGPANSDGALYAATGPGAAAGAEYAVKGVEGVEGRRCGGYLEEVLLAVVVVVQHLQPVPQISPLPLEALLRGLLQSRNLALQPLHPLSPRLHHTLHTDC